MNSDIQRRMDALLATSARLTLEVFFAELAEDACKDFMACSKDSFDAQKGKVQAYKELLNYVKPKR